MTETTTNDTSVIDTVVTVLETSSIDQPIITENIVHPEKPVIAYHWNDSDNTVNIHLVEYH